MERLAAAFSFLSWISGSTDTDVARIPQNQQIIIPANNQPTIITINNSFTNEPKTILNNSASATNIAENNNANSNQTLVTNNLTGDQAKKWLEQYRARIAYSTAAGLYLTLFLHFLSH